MRAYYYKLTSFMCRFSNNGKSVLLQNDQDHNNYSDMSAK